jgi:hypothetical protein
VLHSFVDGFVVCLIRGKVKLHAAFRIPSVKRDRGLVSVFFRGEKDRSHLYKEPNIVSTAVLKRFSVWYVTRCAFQVSTICWSACWNFYLFLPTYVGWPALLTVVQVFPNLHSVTWTYSPTCLRPSGQQLGAKNIWRINRGCNLGQCSLHTRVDGGWT